MTDKNNHETVIRLLLTIIKGESEAIGIAENLKATKEEFKDKTVAEIIAKVDELRIASAEAVVATKDLQALLMRLNEGGGISFC